MELLARRVLGILETYAEPVAALDEEQAEAAYFEDVGGVRLQFAASAFALHGHRYCAGAQFENAGLGGSTGQHDFTGGVFAERVRTLMQPEKAGHGEPAALGLKRGRARAAPLRDFIIERRPRRHSQCRQEAQ